MGTLNHNVQRYGLTEVYTPIPPTSSLVDVVFVHGLNGDPHNTWTSTPKNVFWPADLLPPFIEEQKARLLVYGYDADVASLAGSGVTKDKIHNHAERLVADLFANRRIRKATERPIIFVAHSLGGLVVKRALIYSSDITGVRTEHLRSIFVSTYGILFLGTPHKGSDVASWGSFLEWLCRAVPKKAIDTSDQLIEALKSNSETLQNIDRQFAQLIENFHLFFFHEAKPTDFKSTLRFVVEEESAAPTLPDVERAGIQADHSHMCKFENESSPGFDLVVDGIQRYSEDAPATIGARWTSERSERKTNRIRKAMEIFPGDPGSLSIMQTPPSDTASTPSKPLPSLAARPQIEYEITDEDEVDVEVPSFAGYRSSIHDLRDSKLLPKSDSPKSNKGSLVLPTKPSEPYYSVPPGFRPNTIFVGMERELQTLDKKLFDKKRRSIGTACALIYAQAGAGKSHLTRQYVTKNRKKFPGGVFWINAWSFEELFKDYWQIAQKYVSTDSPDQRISGEETGRQFVDVVKDWFEGRHEWLMVLDGVNIEKDDDFDKLQRFIPNSRDSSLIYVSRAKRLESLERLLRPQAIKVNPLKDDDARKLLLKSIPILHPREAQIRSATELVRKVGGLPLAINAISYRIAYTHEPLEKYTIRSYSEDHKIGGRYHEIMDDLQKRGHMEAFNLVNILCFFGPHIPVELVHLGQKTLRHARVNVKSSENGEKADINNTFGVLMRYGLVERNEPDDKDSMSSSRSSMTDPEPIDMLKMHMVIQKFCCDRLNTSNLLPTWLTYAVRLFCHSFTEADQMIKSRPEHGRVSDYREYLVHGERLRTHTLEYESKTQLLGKLRTELDPTLLLIKEEIQTREPGSSQESVARAEFQISVFDRTSSSSSSGLSASEVKTPGRRPPPLALVGENEYGIPLTKPSTDSPRSIGTISPAYGPRILDHSPHARFPAVFDDNSSERSYPMQQGLSEDTVRGRAISHSSQTPRWEVVPPHQKFRRPDYTHGNFERSPARAQLVREYATGSVTRPPTETRGVLSGSSDAVTSLTRVHHASPPPSRGSLWSRSHSGRSPTSAPARPSYARVLAGPVHGYTSDPSHIQNGPPQIGEGLDTTLDPAGSGHPIESAFIGLSEAHQQSHLRLDFTSFSPTRPLHSTTGESQSIGDTFKSSRVSSGLNYVHGAPSSSSSFHALNTLHGENAHPRYVRPNILGRNPHPLPVESNISITPLRSVPDHDNHHQFRRYDSYEMSQADIEPSLPTYPNKSAGSSPASPPDILTLNGYRSQPLSRDLSQISQVSGTATEPMPPHRTSISPYLNSIAVDSPRIRNLDGSPAHKSPKLGYSNPIPPASFVEQSPDVMVKSVPALLSGAGGWTSAPRGQDTRRIYHFAGTHSDSSPIAGEASPMSRTGSGPGMRVEGLGIDALDKEVVFGEQEPVSVADARRRIMEWEEQLQAKNRGTARVTGRATASSALPPVARLTAGERDVFERGADDTFAGLGIWSPEQMQGQTPYPEVNRMPIE
ncbi:hypothetical protein MMC26_005558 [Xylographa opegraphella]|nr:hypothetical protein [Xylographa opegraphella]